MIRRFLGIVDTRFANKSCVNSSSRRRSFIHPRGFQLKSVILAALILLLPVLIRAQGLNVPIVVQPAEWPAMPTVGPTGTRTNAPVTFGVGIPDSAGIDCPGTQDKPENEGAPTTLELTNGSVQLNAQFRCMARWPSGNAQWVLVDAQLPSFTEGTPGYDTSIALVQVASGGGNFPASNMAQQCTAPGAPDPNCPDSNHIVVETGAATFLIKENNYNLFDDVYVGSTHIVWGSNHGPYDGLVLLGPSAAMFAAKSADSVSCSPGPIPTSYHGPSVCSNPYASSLDNTSTCTIEENGPLRSVVMCQGNLVDSTGDVYMHWRTRTHFWANHTDAKVTVGMRNADVPAVCCETPNFANAYKEFTQFEARVTDNLGSPSSRNFDFANDTAESTTGTLSAANGTDKVFLYQGYSQNGEWPHWTNAFNCATEADACVVSPIPRTGTPGDWTYAANGYQINRNGATVKSGGNTQFPIGWADLDDGTNGIETGVYQFSMYWPKSLEFQPGIANHNEIRVGIWPNQQEFIAAHSAVSYAMGWPEYSVHDTYWNFHSGTQTPAVAQNNFLYFQHYLLARPASGTYYDTVKDATSGFSPLFYDIPDPKAEDGYYIGLGLCSTAPGQCVGDIGSANSPWNSAAGPAYTGMKIFRYWGWSYAGGIDGTQFEQRNSFLRNWLQRGGSSTLGSVPGRYIWASHWYRMITEKSLPRSDTPKTYGAGAGFRSLCTTQSACNSLNFDAWGDPRNNTLAPVWNGGMRNWGDDPNAMDHSTYWGIFTYYFLSGDEWVKEQLLQGFKDRYQNPFVSYNNLQANAGLNSAPGHGHINAIRATGHWFSGAARLMEFLRSVRDPDADTPATVLTSPGLSPANATVLQGIEQNIAAQIAMPYIASGYPKGWSETTAANCSFVGTPTQLCSQGVSPVRGFVRSGGGGEDCGEFGGKLPCDDFYHRADDTFQVAVWAEGVYDIWFAMRDLLSKDWHLQINGVSDGAMGPFNVTISEKNLTDMLYGSYQQLSEENCVNTGAYATSGCVYTQFSDYLDAAPGCTASGDCLHTCITGCTGLTEWFGLAAPAATTNSTLDLTGKPWQFMFESQMINSGIINMELGSHMMQFGVNYILADGSSKSNSYEVKPAIPVLTQLPITVTPNPCVGPPSGTGACTITWTAPAGLTAVNGVQYRLKYLPCQSGVLTIYGNDCPAGGKTIVPALRFHSDITTAGFPAPDGTGSWEIDPSKNWNWAFTVDVPDCLAGQSAPNCNPVVASGTSYTFNTQPNTTYTFSLSAYATGAISSNPPTVAITSPVPGIKVNGTAVTVLASASSDVGIAGVQFELDGANLGTEVTTSPYFVTWDTTTASNGFHTLTAVAVDTAGNQATSTGVTVTVNNSSGTSPIVSITAPAPGATVSGTSVPVSASASSSIGVAGVQFLLDGTNLSAEVTTAPYSLLWNTTTSANGIHSLTATVYDTAGNHTTSNHVSVTVSNGGSAPTVTLTSPAPGSTLANTVTLSATASSSKGIASVQFKLNGANLGSKVVSAPYSTTWNTTTVTNGTYTLSATAVDTAGNVGNSNAVSVTVSNTHAPPAVSVTAPAPGATLRGTVTLSANASSSIGIKSVQFKLNGAALGSPILSPPYSTTFDTTRVGNGSYSFTAMAIDTAGTVGTSSAVAVTINNNDTTAPTVTITAPAAGATLTNFVTISATASGVSGIASVQFKVNGSNVGSPVVSVPYSTSWDTTKVANGNYSLTAAATDTAGNVGTSPAVAVTVSNPTNTTPTVAVTSPASGATLSGKVNVSATASDASSVPSVQFTVDGVNLGSAILTAPYTVPWDTTLVSNGSHTLQATARDAAGKTATAAVLVQVNNAPATPAIGTKSSTAIDTLTQFSVQMDDLSSAVASCSGCQFLTLSDLTPGQSTLVILRSSTATPTADRVVLQQGALNGTIVSVSGNQFTLQPLGNPAPASVLVMITTGLTDLEGFSGSPAVVATGQTVAVRGLLFKSGPQAGPTLIARQVELLPSAAPAKK